MSRILPYHRRMLRLVPKKRHLKGGWLHRMLGERLFHSDLWALTPQGAAGGMALGLFIACTPTFGIQLALAGFFAFLLRVNIPMAMLGCLLTNPLTAPMFYAMELKLGLWMVGKTTPEELQGFSGTARNIMRYAKPLWFGSVTVGAFCATLGYLGTYWLLLTAGKVRHARRVARRKASVEKRKAAAAAKPRPEGEESAVPPPRDTA